jgi:hypothetical protein
MRHSMKNLIYSILLVLICIGPVSCIAEEVITDSEGRIDATWIEGTVITSPFKTDHLRMKVDKVTYIIMPQCKTFQLETSETGAYYEKPIGYSAIRKGDAVALKAHGNRVFQINVLEQR